MNKMCVSCLGALLLALYLSSQIQAEESTLAPTPAMTTNATMTMTTYYGNMTANVTDSKSGSGRTDAWTLLLPLTVSASLLHIWS